jgi:hypothetical protein
VVSSIRLYCLQLILYQQKRRTRLVVRLRHLGIAVIIEFLTSRYEFGQLCLHTRCPPPFSSKCHKPSTPRICPLASPSIVFQGNSVMPVPRNLAYYFHSALSSFGKHQWHCRSSVWRQRNTALQHVDHWALSVEQERSKYSSWPDARIVC